ncbi:MAG: hypothetical protein ACOY42_07195, partial [Pseudomonadota bacterium]
MARYKDDNRNQTKVIPVAFDRQMLPGSFEYSLAAKRHPVPGRHNRETLEYLDAESIDGYLADTGFRSRDPRFKDYQEPPARNNRKDVNDRPNGATHDRVNGATCTGHLRGLERGQGLPGFGVFASAD